MNIKKIITVGLILNVGAPTGFAQKTPKLNLPLASIPTQQTLAPTPVPTKTPLVDTGILKKNNKGLVNLDFINAEIGDIAKSISELTQRNFVFDEQVRGKITLVSPQPVTVEEAYRAFISALEVKNFTVIKIGRLYKIVPIRDMKTQAIPTDESSAGGFDEFVTRLIPVKHTNALELSKSLRSLVSKNGDLTAYGPTNTLIITDALGNIKRLLKIVENLDQKGFQESVQVIPLKYAPASDTADKVQKIFGVSGRDAASRMQNPNGTSPEDAGQFISSILADERTNSLIVVANAEGFERIKMVVKQIDQAIIDQAGKGRVHVHYLQYADASELAATLSGVAPSKNSGSATRNAPNNIFTTTPQGMVTPPTAPRLPMAAGPGMMGENVKITADVFTNSLVITASPSDYESLLPVINKLDIRRPQAFVEAMILEVNIDKASDLGFTGNLGGDIKDAKVFGTTNFGSNSSIFLPTSGAALQGLSAIVQGPTFDIPLTDGKTLTIPGYGALFKALQSNGTINVLSTPNILTQDNTEAEIVVGSVVPFITAQGRDVNNQPINQIQREDVAMTLKITPQINSSDELTLQINQESQDLVPGADISTFGPTTSRRSAKTTVLVKDGQTITVGGLISDRIQSSQNKVPLLGDIPILGWFFKSTSKKKSKTSLVIFITPHIIRYPEDLEKVTLRKNIERERFLEQNRIADHPQLDAKKLKESLKVPARRQYVPVEEQTPVAQEEPPVEQIEPQDPPAEVTEPSPPVEVPEKTQGEK